MVLRQSSQHCIETSCLNNSSVKILQRVSKHKVGGNSRDRDRALSCIIPFLCEKSEFYQAVGIRLWCDIVVVDTELIVVCKVSVLQGLAPPGPLPTWRTTSGSTRRSPRRRRAGTRSRASPGASTDSPVGANTLRCHLWLTIAKHIFIS